MTDPSWWLTQEDASPRNMVDPEQEPDTKNLTDDPRTIISSKILINKGNLSEYFWILIIVWFNRSQNHQKEIFL